jgi:hypothetical protein
MDRDSFTRAMRDFIRLVSGESAESAEVPTDLNLFDAGLLESFKLPRLVAFLTEELQLPVDLTQVGFESFYTIDRMYATFARPGAGAA